MIFSLLPLTNLLVVHTELGVPIAEYKLVTPATSITYLGIEIDSVTVRLPAEKLHILKTELLGWTTKNKTTKKDYTFYHGKLAFAAKVVNPGRIFYEETHRLDRVATRI